MNTATPKSKILLVTGGSGGIGKSIALNAAKGGLELFSSTVVIPGKEKR